MKYYIIMFALLLQSCSNCILVKKQEYLKGKEIYNFIQPKGYYDINYTADYLVENTNKLDTCQQYLLIAYVLSDGMKNSNLVLNYEPSFVSNLVGNMKFYTQVYRGLNDGHIGTYYVRKRDAKKDLKDWKRKLNCK